METKTSRGQRFILTLFTNDAALAAGACRAGVDRIGLDLERIDKHLRQGGMGTWISDHDETELARIAAAVTAERLFARCNSLHADSAAEIDRLLDAGVRTLMLPHFKSWREAERFVRIVDGRARPVLLLETAAAADDIGELCHIDGVGEIHIGLNDMRLSLAWPSHFHVLVSPQLQRLCDTILDAGLALAVGGVGRCGDNDLPIPADQVLAQYPRLGAGGALLSRAFFRDWGSRDLTREIAALRQRLDDYWEQPHAWLRQQQELLRDNADQRFGVPTRDWNTGAVSAPSAPARKY